MNKLLVSILSDAYSAKVLHQGSVEAVTNRLRAAVADPAFALEARAEWQRARAVKARRCFTSGVVADFLSPVLDGLVIPTPTKTIAPIPVITTVVQTTKSEPKKEEDMSKLKNLADLAKSVTTEVESRAEASLTRLQKAQTKAHGGLDKLDNVTADIEQSATELEDFTNQVSNGPPA